MSEIIEDENNRIYHEGIEPAEGPGPMLGRLLFGIRLLPGNRQSEMSTAEIRQHLRDAPDDEIMVSSVGYHDEYMDLTAIVALVTALVESGSLSGDVRRALELTLANLDLILYASASENSQAF